MHKCVGGTLGATTSYYRFAKANESSRRREARRHELSWRRGLLLTLCSAFAELLRRSRGSGRRLSMLLGWGCCCSRCFLLLLHLLVMVLVLRGALGRLSGLALWPTWLRRRGRGAALRLGGSRSLRRRRGGALRLLIGRRSLRRRGGGLRGLLCHYRQRHRKHDERS